MINNNKILECYIHVKINTKHVKNYDFKPWTFYLRKNKLVLTTCNSSSNYNEICII